MRDPPRDLLDSQQSHSNSTVSALEYFQTVIQVVRQFRAVLRSRSYMGEDD